MTVIAMTREMGTRGKDVAAIVAEALGLQVVHHEVVERHVAERMHVDETLVHRFLEGESSLWDRWRIDGRQVSQCTAEEILGLAVEGNVLIRGWGAAQLLADVPHVLTVRVCAPMAFRVAEMRGRLALDDDKLARREIERSDEAHDRAVRALFGSGWRRASGYAISLNTGHMSVETAGDLLIALARTPSFAETEASRAVLADKLVLARVRATLRASGHEAGEGGGLDITVSDGVVTLAGITTNEAAVRASIALIRKVEGVRGVESSVRYVAIGYSA